MKPPHNVADLERALRKLGGSDENGYRLRCVMADVVAGQFLSGAVLRGGSSLKLRYGNATTRFTVDFDIARSTDEQSFLNAFNERLDKGWGGFSGRLAIGIKATPKDVPQEYVMQPYTLKLTYARHPWCSVAIEASYNELGDADDYELITVPADIMELFQKLNLPEPNPIPVMSTAHQFAQKIHGATDSASCRAQDIIDLQLMADREIVDLPKIRHICERLFANRKRQPWPTLVSVNDSMKERYEYMREGMPVRSDFDSAVAWLNGFIREISESQ